MTRSPFDAVLTICILMVSPVVALGQAQSTVTIQIPATAGFNVVDVSRVTASAPFTIRITDSKLRGQLKNIRIGVRSTAASFNPPRGPAMPVSLVFWNTGAVQNGVGSGGTLNNASYTTVFTSANNPKTASVQVLWNLAAPGPTIRAGAHTLTVNWRIEAF